MGAGRLGGAGLNPRWYVPAPTLSFDGENRSCRKPASLQVDADYASHTGDGRTGARPRAAAAHPSPPPEPTVGDTLENSVCSKHPPDRLNVHPWNVEVSTECGIGVVLALGPTLGNLVGAPAGHRGAALPPPRPLAGRRRRRRPHPSAACTHRSQPMGLFRVKDIAAPEVKFLDRCEIHGSEGVLQVHVRRSRMRVRGAKMIRHRRSPATVNYAGQALAGQNQSDPVRATPPTSRNPQPVGSGGSTVARLKLKRIDC